MKRPVAPLPHRAGTAEISPRLLLSLTTPSEGRAVPAAPPLEQRTSPRSAALHPSAFLESLLPPDYYLG